MPAGLILPIASAVVSAAGAGYGIESSISAQNKMNQDVANQVAEENQLQKQATPIYQQNLVKATAPQAAQQGQQQALQSYQQAQALPASTQPVVDAPPSRSVDARTQAGVARGQQASAALQQYPAMQTAWNVGNTNTNAQLGNITAIGQSNASILPAELAQAQAQGQEGQSIGNAIGSVGGLVGSYALGAPGRASNAALLAKIQAMSGGYNSSPLGPTSGMSGGVDYTPSANSVSTLS